LRRSSSESRSLVMGGRDDEAAGFDPCTGDDACVPQAAFLAVAISRKGSFSRGTLGTTSRTCTSSRSIAARAERRTLGRCRRVAGSHWVNGSSPRSPVRLRWSRLPSLGHAAATGAWPLLDEARAVGADRRLPRIAPGTRRAASSVAERQTRHSGRRNRERLQLALPGSRAVGLSELAVVRVARGSRGRASRSASRSAPLRGDGSLA
jgi:hypothetical protein